MSSDTEPNIPSPKATLDQLKEWQELLAYLAAGIGTVLGIFLSSGAAQIASTVLAALVVTGGSWQLRRSQLRKKQREEQERLWEERRNQPRAAFRSLSPFEEQDELPGQDRKQLARSIAVRIVNDDFRFGIVCGDSGAGKTSLLRAEVMRHIRANGLEPVYLRRPRRLADLEAFAQEQIPADKCVLILDQFEEWLVEHREPEARALLGRFIARLIQRVPPVRVVCAVRREFLMDFHDLAAELPDPTNPANTFRVRNFTVAQAIDAVQQCALADGIAAEEAFAAALAADLEENGEVRPPELQIVCTHLAESGSLSSDRYQAEGGTAGILAHHIKNALESCREPELGAKLLRSLCDFPTRTKRPPKTQAELAADIGRTAGSQTVAALVRTFVLARLLAEEKRKSGPDAYALLHDYLVGAVELATGDVSTQTEEANQLLRYHLAQQRGVIPLRKLRFIRAHADRPLLVQPNARRLLRKSLIVPMAFSGAMVFVAVLMAGGLYLMVTARVQWQAKVIGRHWNKDESGGGMWMLMSYKILSKKGQIISGPDWKSEHIRFWDAKSGHLVASAESGREIAVSSNGEFILIKSNLLCRVISAENIGEIKEIPLEEIDTCNFLKNEDGVAIVNRGGIGNTVNLSLWSAKKKKEIFKIKNIPLGNSTKPSFHFSEESERLVVSPRKGDIDTITIYNASSGQKIRDLTDSGYDPVAVGLHSSTKKICTISRIYGTEELLIQLWNIDNGNFMQQRKFLTPKKFHYPALTFTKDGRYILFQDETDVIPRLISIFSATDMKLLWPRKSASNYIYSNKSEFIVFWQEDKNLKIWNVGNSTQNQLLNIHIEDQDRIISSDDLRLAVIWGPQRPAELWDVKEKKLLRLLTSSKDKHIQSVAFSMNDTAVVITEEGGVASLFDAKDGSPLAQHISAASVYYYDPDLRRIHLWNSSGQVIRHVEGRSYFGWFVPTKKGAMD